jgi:hypothetical protein
LTTATKNNKLLTFTFIADFRGGTYCSQVQAENIHAAVVAWIVKLQTEKKQIQYLGDKIIEELQTISENKDHLPTPLTELKNVWFAHYTTRQGSFSVNIVQTVSDDDS